MKLLTKANETKLQKQYPMGASMESQKVVAKVFNPTGSWSWYLMNQDPSDPNYLWAIVKGNEVEAGSVLKSELEGYKGPLGIGLERDRSFTPRPAKEVYEGLLEGKHF